MSLYAPLLALLREPRNVLNPVMDYPFDAADAESTDSAATPARSSFFISSLPAVEADKAVH